MKIKKVVMEQAVIKKVKDKMMKFSEMARNIIEENTNKEIREYGKMMSTNIRITEKQENRLKKIKPHNFSKFINDKTKEKIR